MARTLDIEQGPDREALGTLLWKTIQSANLNFIIGCSTPAIPPLGNIEKEVQAKLSGGVDSECPFGKSASLSCDLP